MAQGDPHHQPARTIRSWSLRGWLLCKFAGLEFDEISRSRRDDPSARAEILLLSPSILVPCLHHDGIKVWDTLAIAEYLNEIMPDAGLLPADRVAARALPLDLRRNAFRLHQPALGAADEPEGAFPRLQGLGRARRPTSTGSVVIWRECLDSHGGPFLFGERTHGGRHVRAGRDPLHDL